ncbi:hypothetical protein H7J87_17895 [Mycolicibacterium wolinskyi]|uniref:Uncharacterized protein n=1 Tax=Mycolicibacterium wolinskyi TaxID=59750 RepID=A0A1X2EUT9_9MYCO|nr:MULTISPECIES: hypothetical protein [Mycolicibacterium]MCV7287199.1 hypothetical protein [Mycolicibacterium wolinskyi]MCV7292692.1 hypothetical protein [Mycolicibacterium goodii]ORX09886.1 hypothetical protein AWC31_06680 [Mycolicibacterium wolinskyi]
MGLDGTWDVKIKTPIGSLAVIYRFSEIDGIVTGSAEGRGETVRLEDITVVNQSDAQQVTWKQSITKPMRLNLDFDVRVTGDQMSGHSKAGRLPRSAVSGIRRVNQAG